MANSPEYNAARKEHARLGHLNIFENCGFKACQEAQKLKVPSIVSDNEMRTTHRSQEALDVLRDGAVERLVAVASNVLTTFRDGRNPSFARLDLLESCLFPFTASKLCGHNVFEECDCFEDK